ncbi:SLAM family member 5 isoform X2 [Puntigrus tetrazona]|nr:SLAM family member 5 isoform X2 [Puntigrus tetrazona]XP_043078824.1 SLAM family member 5 isoform X2 [Puntigrus tetrazona]
MFGAEADEIVSLSVMEGDSVTLKTGVTKIQEDDLIMWMSGNYSIAKLSISSQVISETHDTFRGRLKLDDQTGSLTITNTRTTDSGLYKAQMIGQQVSKKTFNVAVVASLPVPVLASYCPQNPSSGSSRCLLLCSAVNVGHVTLSWYKGDSLLSSISVSDLSISLSLPLEVEHQDKNTYSCVINNPIRNQTTHLDFSQLCQPCSECVCCCNSTEAVIQLVLSALVGVATAVVLVYDIRSRRAEQKRRALKSLSDNN